jgi:hypothetical protein
MRTTLAAGRDACALGYLPVIFVSVWQGDVIYRPVNNGHALGRNRGYDLGVVLEVPTATDRGP